MVSQYDKKRTQAEQRAWARQLFAEAQRKGLFGTLSFVFENGVAKRARSDEVILPPPPVGKLQR